jgi:hypothetical protein
MVWIWKVYLHFVCLWDVSAAVVAIYVTDQQKPVWVRPGYRIGRQPPLTHAHRHISFNSRIAELRCTFGCQLAARESLHHVSKRLLQTSLGRPVQPEHGTKLVVSLSRKLHRQVRLADAAKAVDDDDLSLTPCLG